MVAVAECFRGDGEILANPIGTMPMIGGRLAKATFEPALVMTDGEALLVENILPVGVDAPEKVVEAWNPYRSMFDIVWSGRRHVMMGASQIDAFGNQNFAFIGSHAQPKAQLLGMRGAPGNTINDTHVVLDPEPLDAGVRARRSTSSAASATTGPPRSGRRRAVPRRSCASSPTSRVLDFETPDHRMRLAFGAPGRHASTRSSRPPGSSSRSTDDVPETRLPTDEELQLIREVIDPNGLGEQEVPDP